jgi:hypothetical protein
MSFCPESPPLFKIFKPSRILQNPYPILGPDAFESFLLRVTAEKSCCKWVPYSSFTSHTQDGIQTSYFPYISISRLDCSLDLVIKSIRAANTVTRSIAVFNSILLKAGDPMSSFLESQNSAVRGTKASCKMAIRSSA